MNIFQRFMAWLSKDTHDSVKRHGKPNPDDQLNPNWNVADWYRDGELRYQEIMRQERQK